MTIDRVIIDLIKEPNWQACLPPEMPEELPRFAMYVTSEHIEQVMRKYGFYRARETRHRRIASRQIHGGIVVENLGETVYIEKTGETRFRAFGHYHLFQNGRTNILVDIRLGRYKKSNSLKNYSNQPLCAKLSAKNLKQHLWPVRLLYEHFCHILVVSPEVIDLRGNTETNLSKFARTKGHVVPFYTTSKGYYEDCAQAMNRYSKHGTVIVDPTYRR